MGWVNKAKESAAGQAAAAAYGEGRQIFMFKIIEATQGNRSTGLMTGVGDQIEAIEAAGWYLDKMAGAEGKAMTGDRTALVCLFRRRQ